MKFLNKALETYPSVSLLFIVQWERRKIKQRKLRNKKDAEHKKKIETSQSICIVLQQRQHSKPCPVRDTRHDGSAVWILDLLCYQEKPGTLRCRYTKLTCWVPSAWWRDWCEWQGSQDFCQWHINYRNSPILYWGEGQQKIKTVRLRIFSGQARREQKLLVADTRDLLEKGRMI